MNSPLNDAPVTQARADTAPVARSGALLCWALVANVRRDVPLGPAGQQLRRGTRHFSPGSKVYCGQPLWGDGYEHIAVIARHRGSRRYTTMVLSWKRLTNWRVQAVYEPALFRVMPAGLPGFAERNIFAWDKDAAGRAAAAMRLREAEYLAELHIRSSREVHLWIDETFHGLTHQVFLEQLRDAEERQRTQPAAAVIVQLNHIAISDGWLAALCLLHRVDVLELGGLGITDAGLAYLGHLTMLKELSLARTGVTDSGLAALGQFRILERLRLDATAVTDTGLSHLADLPSLRVLTLWGTRVTEDGVRRLMEVRPALEVKGPWPVAAG